jgi:hypothetical protein
MSRKSIYSDFHSGVKYLDERMPFNLVFYPKGQKRDWDSIYLWWVYWLNLMKSDKVVVGRYNDK